MKKPGQVALVPFPRVDLTPGKPRPVLLLARVPGPYDDWLVAPVLHPASSRGTGL
jgi:mRNA interferase MazF